MINHSMTGPSSVPVSGTIGNGIARQGSSAAAPSLPRAAAAATDKGKVPREQPEKAQAVAGSRNVDKKTAQSESSKKLTGQDKYVTRIVVRPLSRQYYHRPSAGIVWRK
jgi:hypothetical protein